MTRGELQDLLVKFCSEDAKYRSALADDPGDIVARQFGLELPPDVAVKAVQETADTVYVVIPHVDAESAELADADLDRVSGGGSRTRHTSQPIAPSNTSSAIGGILDYTASCGANIGAANTQTVINL